MFTVHPVLPIKAADIKNKMQHQRSLQISQIYDNVVIYVNKGFNEEFFKLYQTLADEGIQVWRKDSVTVVKNELEKGDLTYLSHGENKLISGLINKDEMKGIIYAAVIFENDKLKAEITLHRYWEAVDGV